MISDWAPIATAPKNGPILGSREGHISIYRWNDDIDSRRPKPYWATWRGKSVDRGHQPTHWMPLPEPPLV